MDWRPESPGVYAHGLTSPLKLPQKFQKFHKTSPVCKRPLDLMGAATLSVASRGRDRRQTTINNSGQKYRDKFQNSVFMYSPIDVSGFQHCLREGGGLPKIRNDDTIKLMTTGYRYPEHKCTLQSLFSYLSQKILASIVDRISHLDGNGFHFDILRFMP